MATALSSDASDTVERRGRAGFESPPIRLLQVSTEGGEGSGFPGSTVRQSMQQRQSRLGLRSRRTEEDDLTAYGSVEAYSAGIVSSSLLGSSGQLRPTESGELVYSSSTQQGGMSRQSKSSRYGSDSVTSLREGSRDSSGRFTPSSSVDMDDDRLASSGSGVFATSR